MTLRPPNLAALSRILTGADTLEAEIAAEKATALGRTGRAVEKAMADFAAAEPGERRTALAYAAADALHALFIQRELMGLRSHGEVIRQYGVPGEVLAKVGAKPSA